jgi:chromosome segregation ATPase
VRAKLRRVDVAKAKFIIIGLIGALLIFVFLFLQNLNQKQRILRERDDLKKENITLSSKIEKLQGSIRENEKKIDLLNKELDRVSGEKQELERRYELLNKTKDELMEKLKAKEEEVAQRQKPSPMVEAAFPEATDAYWATILKAKTDLELQLGTLRSELKTTQINNEQLQRDKSNLELDINNLKREREDLKRQFEYNKKITDSIAQELVRERNDKMQVQDSFKVIKSENTLLNRQLKSINTRKINLERKLQALQEEKNSLERRLNEMETMLTDKISQVNRLKEQLEDIKQGVKTEAIAPAEKETVELPSIVVRPQQELQAPTMPSPQGGKILAINKESNFVIIDLGEEHGIRVGDVLQVYREDKFVASIEAIQVRRNITACDIKQQTLPINIGDTIK